MAEHDGHADAVIALERSYAFDGVAALARLPWFAHDDGAGPSALELCDRSVGPIIDMHTHLALAFGRPMQLDLHRETAEVAHYLPAGCAFELDVYVNRNFTKPQLRAMKRDLFFDSLTAKGMRATHTVPNLTREMRALGIERSVVLPIDLPLLSANARHALDAARADERIVGWGSVHPYSTDLAAKLDEQAHRGALGIKMHPTAQMVHPSDPRARKLYRLCGERRLIVFWHCGPVGIEPALGRFLTQVRHYERAIAENPGVTFVLGHAGALQGAQALALAQRHRNVYLETSSQSLAGVRAIVAGADPDRIVYGSDWPFYHAAIPIAKVLIATEHDHALRSKILYRNAARLLGLD